MLNIIKANICISKNVQKSDLRKFLWRKYGSNNSFSLWLCRVQNRKINYVTACLYSHEDDELYLALTRIFIYCIKNY